MGIRGILTATFLVLALSSFRHAATLITPPLVPTGDRLLECLIINVSSQPLTVTMQIWDGSGNVIASSGNFTLQPGLSGVIGAPAIDTPRYCKFIVSGPKTTVRATAAIILDGDTIVALPAQ